MEHPYAIYYRETSHRKIVRYPDGKIKYEERCSQSFRVKTKPKALNTTVRQYARYVIDLLYLVTRIRDCI